MTDKLSAAESALKVQRDSAHRQRDRLAAENRHLKNHQADIRAWLKDAIKQWEAEPTTAVAIQIHQRATEILLEAERYL